MKDARRTPLRKAKGLPAAWPAAVVALAFLHGCGAEGPVAPPGPRPSPSPEASPTPSPVPAPSATPEPPPTPPSNRPPTVSIGGGGSCHPTKLYGTVEPCFVTFTASGHDPDGDRLTYAWSGCASGSGEMAQCRIDRPGIFTAVVTVSDGRGGRAQASATAEGTNEVPNPRLLSCFRYYEGYWSCWWEGWDNLDPDGDSWGCDHPRAEGAACTGGALNACGGVGDAIEVEFRVVGTGQCTVSVSVHDPWAERTVSTTFTVTAR